MNPELASAYSYCERVARQHYENFPVASFLLPAAARPHIAAVYAFARVADDLADEGDVPPAERLAALDRWSARLLAAAYGEPQARDEHANVFLALSNTIRTCRLQVPLLQDLLSAFRQDVTVTRYESWADVLDYCRRSANPVGRLVLKIAGYEDPALDVKADAVCTALQVTNFLQDLQIDWRRGRLYVPREFWQPAGARESDLDAAQLTPEWRDAVREVGAKDAIAVHDRAERVRRRRRAPAVRASRDMARRHADPGPARACAVRRRSLIVRPSARRTRPR